MKNLSFGILTFLLVIQNPVMGMDPSSIGDLINARSAFDSKDYEKAIEYYEGLIDRDVLSDEDRNEALYRLGVSYENEAEPREAAYFYGEYVRINRSSEAFYKEALFKAGKMNLANATGQRDQSYTKFAIIYLNTFVELYPGDERANEAQANIDQARDLNAEFHFSQYGSYYFRHKKYCGAFISFEDSLNASPKYLEEITSYTNECQSNKGCRDEVLECIEKFQLENIDALKILL